MPIESIVEILPRHLDEANKLVHEGRRPTKDFWSGDPKYCEHCLIAVACSDHFKQPIHVCIGSVYVVTSPRKEGEEEELIKLGQTDGLGLVLERAFDVQAEGLRTRLPTSIIVTHVEE